MTFNEEITLDHLYNVQDGQKMLSQLRKFFGTKVMTEQASDPLNDFAVSDVMGKDITSLGGEIHAEVALLIASVLGKHTHSGKNERKRNDTYRMLSAIMFEILVQHMMAAVVEDLFNNTEWIVDGNTLVSQAQKQAVFMQVQHKLLHAIVKNIGDLGERTGGNFLHLWGKHIIEQI